MEDLMYRVYVTDSLKSIAGIEERFYDLINLSPAAEETRTPEEIIARVSAVFRGGED